MLAVAATPAQAIPVPYDIFLNETTPGSNTFVGTFTVEDTDILAGSGVLTSFQVTIGADSWELATDSVTTNAFTSDTVDVVSLSLSITDDVAPGGFGVILDVFSGGFWGAGEIAGDYSFQRAVAVAEPSTISLLGASLLFIGTAAARRRWT